MLEHKGGQINHVQLNVGAVSCIGSGTLTVYVYWPKTIKEEVLVHLPKHAGETLRCRPDSVHKRPWCAFNGAYAVNRITLVKVNPGSTLI